MPKHHRKETSLRAARLAIWTIRRQAFLISRILRYIWTAAFTVFVLALAGIISIDAAVYTTFLGGSAIMVLFWIAAEKRRTWLMNIRDERLRHEAHQAMIKFIETKMGGRVKASRNEHRDRVPTKCRHC